MLKKLLLLLALSISVPSIAQIVNIPDANFKACLLSNTAINTNGDSEIQVSEAENYTGTLNCSSEGITDVTGVEAFINLLNTLAFSNNPINGSVDFTTSPNVRNVSVSNSGITAINLTGLNLLENLNLQFNEVNNLDVSSLSSLETLTIGYNPLTSLTFGATNTSLVNLNADEITMMPILDLSPLTSLENILMQNCEFNELILPSTTTLTSINLFGSDILEIDTSVATNLVTFSNPGNDVITSLDLSANTMLDAVSVSGSDTLTEFILASGNNDNITTLNAASTTALDCIEVDMTIDLNNPPSGWIADPNDIYSYDCAGVPAIVNIPDANFKACLIANTAIDTNSDGEVQVTEADAYTGTIECENMGIVSVTGIEAFSGINTVLLNDNSIDTINLSNNPEVFTARIVNNPTTSINVNGTSALISLQIGNTQIETLDLTNNPNFTRLFAQTSQLRSVDFSNNPNMLVINVRSTNITALDVSMLANLQTLSFGDNELTNLDVSNNPLLESLTANDNQLVNVDLTNNPSLTDVNLSFNTLETLDVSNGNNAILQTFRADSNPDLECIQVDETIDLNNPPADWEKDATASYSYDCMSLGVTESFQNSIEIYPNPTSGIVTILATDMIKKITVTTLQGRVLATQTNPKINFSYFSEGIYLMIFENEKGVTEIKRIIKK